MSAAELLTTLTAVGAVLTVEDGRLVLDAPADSLTADLEAAIVRHKSALLVLLKPESVPVAPSPTATSGCTLCGPAGPMQYTAVCADCCLRWGWRRALRLAGLRRHAINHPRPIPSSEELYRYIAEARRQRLAGQQAETTEEEGA